jgi:hypothetical protein
LNDEAQVFQGPASDFAIAAQIGKPGFIGSGNHDVKIIKQVSLQYRSLL